MMAWIDKLNKIQRGIFYIFYAISIVVVSALCLLETYSSVAMKSVGFVIFFGGIGYLLMLLFRSKNPPA